MTLADQVDSLHCHGPCTCSNDVVMLQSKAILIGPRGFQEAEAPRIFRQSASEGGKVVGPTLRPPLPVPPDFNTPKILTPCNTAICCKVSLVISFLEGSLQCSQVSAVLPCPEEVKSILHFRTPFLEDPCHLYLPTYTKFSKMFSSLRQFDEIFDALLTANYNVFFTDASNVSYQDPVAG